MIDISIINIHKPSYILELPSGVIKDGLLENTLFTWVSFLLKPPFIVDFQVPRLRTPEGTALPIGLNIVISIISHG